MAGLLDYLPEDWQAGLLSFLGRQRPAIDPTLLGQGARASLDGSLTPIPRPQGLEEYAGATYGQGRQFDPVQAAVALVGGPRLGPRGAVASFPQFAEKYPEAGPPALMFDKKKGVEYLGKQLTPEAEQFQKARDAIRKDMEKNGYTPYFDPAKREMVDPANYPRDVDTLGIVPKKQATIDKDMATIGSPEARQRLQDAYKSGSELPDAKDWYAVKQIEDAFIKELGPAEGRRAFEERFANSMAATTGGADPTSNFLMAHYGNYLRQNNLPLPEASHQYPFPIGGRYAASNMEQYQKLGTGTYDAANPKRYNFSANFLGHTNRATMDEQMTSGMTPGVQMPPPGKYGLYEGVLQDEAAKAGVDPMTFQEVGWAGFKRAKEPDYQGKPMVAHVNDSIERTARLTGMSPDEIVRRGLVRGEIPMYAIGGLLSLPALQGWGEGR